MEFLASDPQTRSNTSVCLKITDVAPHRPNARRARGAYRWSTDGGKGHARAARLPLRRRETAVRVRVLQLDAAGVKAMAALLEKENVALDIGAYRSAPPGLRIWCGPTIEVRPVGPKPAAHPAAHPAAQPAAQSAASRLDRTTGPPISTPTGAYVTSPYLTCRVSRERCVSVA